MKVGRLVGRVGKRLLSGIRTGLGFQLPRRILSRLDYNDTNKSRQITIKASKGKSYASYEVMKDGRVVRKYRVFDDNGNYLKTLFTLYDNNGLERRKRTLVEKDLSEIERDSLFYSKIPKEIISLINENRVGVGFKVEMKYSSVVSIITFKKEYLGFLQRNLYYHYDAETKRPKYLCSDFVYFDKKGRQLKIRKNVIESEESVKSTTGNISWFDKPE